MGREGESVCEPGRAPPAERARDLEALDAAPGAASRLPDMARHEGVAAAAGGPGDQVGGARRRACQVAVRQPGAARGCRPHAVRARPVGAGDPQLRRRSSRTAQEREPAPVGGELRVGGRLRWWRHGGQAATVAVEDPEAAARHEGELAPAGERARVRERPARRLGDRRRGRARAGQIRPRRRGEGHQGQERPTAAVAGGAFEAAPPRRGRRSASTSLGWGRRVTATTS